MESIENILPAIIESDYYDCRELYGVLHFSLANLVGVIIDVLKVCDLFYPEIIDPETGEQVGDGERGELVITTLRKEAMPIIRYRTGDITVLESEKCACGRTHQRIMRILGRTDDMLIVRGVNVFPSQIEEVLMNIKEIGDQYQIVVDRKRHRLDELLVRVELNEEGFTGDITDLQNLKDYVEWRLKEAPWSQD